MKLRKEAKYLMEKDPILANVIQRVPPFKKKVAGNYFISLVESIISQQLSVKAADTIYARFEKLFLKSHINPEELVGLTDEEMRSVGISYQKISYLRDLANKTLESGILFEQFETMTDAEIIEELIRVKGIGRWSAEMFLMFAMGRPNVFSYGDLGLRNAIEKLYGFDHKPTQEEAEAIAEKWHPYKTLACLYLWKSNQL